MQKISLITIGCIKTPWISEGCEMYIDRLKHSFNFSERILEAGDPAQEEKKLIKAIDGIDGTIVLLDAAGKQQSSEEFSVWFQKERDAGRPITFIIGGAYGLSSTFKKDKAMLSLGKMTFPHEVSKLLLLEQLFRAEAIRQNTGYHH